MGAMLTLTKVILNALGQKTPGDFALQVAGLALAGGSVAFAGYMISAADQGPRINSPEHFAIFAQPVSVPYAGGGQRRPDFDMTPVGTVRTRAAMTKQPDLSSEKIVADYRMRAYSQGEALVQGPSGLINVRAGSEIEGVGQVIGVEARGRSLVIVTTGGLIVSDD